MLFGAICFWGGLVTLFFHPLTGIGLLIAGSAILASDGETKQTTRHGVTARPLPAPEQADHHCKAWLATVGNAEFEEYWNFRDQCKFDAWWAALPSGRRIDASDN